MLLLRAWRRAATLSAMGLCSTSFCSRSTSALTSSRVGTSTIALKLPRTSSADSSLCSSGSSDSIPNLQVLSHATLQPMV
ncbi:hypothetical protein TSOC_009855 [Tetrabaena socialis]|uniref:Uncharacterized protein n=1 Tax=Tetrabaena socialis TaxID=47790 RepID=A0A2J7ZUV1_9CHLO|nr:hypothetical protein TSOC_009855 [Tetrabaena socialis]|eukprot:PNH04029.1 hypothetical protein TSOC_009855 [Tetrabaena socialis]